MHIKRQNIGKFWPVPRKGTKYLAVSTHNQKSSIPLIVALRDMLKLVRNKKELKKILNEKKIKINGKIIRETNYPLGLFDVISIENLKKNYRTGLSQHNKMIFEEISNNIDKKIIKVIGKKILKKGRVQLNLSDGRNVISKEKANVGDSVLFNFNRGIEKIIKAEVGKEAFVVKGKHAGQKGEIDSIIERGGKKIVKIISNNEKINVWMKNIIVMG